MVNKFYTLLISIFLFNSIYISCISSEIIRNSENEFLSLELIEEMEKGLNNISKEENPDVHRNFEEIVINKGYPIEVHFCKTKDGYNLKNYRIAGGKNESPVTDGSKVPVLLAHGLAGSSDTFIFNEEHLSPGFILANAGYDVWFINIRGNKHSHTNDHISDKDKAFWDFSLHELGLIDVPCVVDHILNKTKRQNLVYIGHSQGGGQFLALCSLYPQYCSEKISGAVLLAPAAILHNTRSPYLKDIVNFRVDLLLRLLGIHHLFHSGEATNQISHILCTYFKLYCEHNINRFVSEDVPEDNNTKNNDVAMAHYPAGTSSKCYSHFAEIIRRKDFVSLIDKKPYPLQNINTPLYILGGAHDRLVTVPDLEILISRLNRNIVKDYKVYPNMGHITFALSKGQDNYIEDLLDRVKKASQ